MDEPQDEKGTHPAQYRAMDAAWMRDETPEERDALTLREIRGSASLLIERLGGIEVDGSEFGGLRPDILVLEWLSENFPGVYAAYEGAVERCNESEFA